MKAFVERIKNDIEYEWAYNEEPIFFKMFVSVVFCVHMLLCLAYAIVVTVTIPLWIVPYMIYWIKKEKQ